MRRFFRSQKNTRLNLQPKKNAGVENFRPKKIHWTQLNGPQVDTHHQ